MACGRPVGTYRRGRRKSSHRAEELFRLRNVASAAFFGRPTPAGRPKNSAEAVT